MVDAVAAETALGQVLFDHFLQFVVYHVLVYVILAVVYVEMLESVHIEVHLVVRAQTVMVYPENGKIGKNIVDGCDRDFRAAVFLYVFRHHVCGCVPELQHGFMNREPLRRGFEGMRLKDAFELVYIRFLGLISHNMQLTRQN